MSTAVMATPREPATTFSFMPREHGATAMLLIPFFSAAILAREWRWTEIAALIAVFCTFAAKDPLVVLARQRWVWKNRRPEARSARIWVAVEAVVLGICAAVLAASWPVWALAGVGAGAFIFTGLAVVINVKNRQRSTLFQIASAMALSSTSLAACLSATGAMQPWCWRLWVLSCLQAAAGILVVHARLDARIAARKGMRIDSRWPRRAAVPASTAAFLLVAGSMAAAIAVTPWIAAALLLAGSGYLYDLHRQKDPAGLQMPLKRVGMQALTVSIVYALLVIAGLW